MTFFIRFYHASGFVVATYGLLKAETVHFVGEDDLGPEELVRLIRKIGPKQVKCLVSKRFFEGFFSKIMISDRGPH